MRTPHKANFKVQTSLVEDSDSQCTWQNENAKKATVSQLHFDIEMQCMGNPGQLFSIVPIGHLVCYGLI